MKRKFYIGQCLNCYQGLLEIVKEKSSGQIIVVCDECEAEWGNPDDALKMVNGSRDKFGEITEATLKEVQYLQWDKYLK